ncbi:hypothetical protein LSTR_LSTR010717 [Laodelphax striatellus]|uniref:AB hydrolase-1 domain-containing protein n=1 Tax=Laodelphax striatellus TaxID=195883 RepID=A0A482WYM6_LAOST|nr:hypothetical protein LSTR_LSTR010717 [Laodelphax striatellus]
MTGTKEPEFELEETDEIIKRFGYEVEAYEVFTERRNQQNYYSQVYRIKGKNGEVPRVDLPPVLLMHGLMGSSSDFVFAGERLGLGFHLAKNGFDVWLGNFRGNYYGGLKNHKEMDKIFWDFSFDEMGTNDLYAIIRFILDATKASKVSYVGFSMGATAAYVMLSSEPQTNQWISRMVNIAPVAYLDYSEMTFIERLSAYVFEGYNAAPNLLFDSPNYKMTPLQFSKTPKCFKSKFKGWCDSFFNGGEFKKFSYGRLADEEKYSLYGGKPPAYGLDKIKVPTLLIRGSKDRFVNDENIEFLKKVLTGVPSVQILELHDYNHLDFLLANNLDTAVFEPLTRYLKTGNYRQP